MSADDNPYDSPQESARDDGSGRVGKRLRLQFWSEEQADRSEGEYLPVKLYLSLAIGLAVGYVALAVAYPLIWATLTSILLVLGTGLLTTKVVFRFEAPRLIWCLTPVFGILWLLVLWVLFKLCSLL